LLLLFIFVPGFVLVWLVIVLVLRFGSGVW